jgi:aryl-alcohol dehydrogenase-like predicted oxidoreductase
MEQRRLGASDVEVSVLALGSWQTYERIPRSEGAEVLRAARACGVTFLEVARYNDMLGTAPIPTGYSEVVFGEVLRASGWPRDEVVIGEKLWWEFDQSPAEELAASLQRTGLERFDFVYSDPPPADMALERVVASVTDLIADGLVRAWGIVNWPPDRILAAARIAERLGVPAPCAAQLPYSLAMRAIVEDPAMEEALEACSASLIPSSVFAGGVLTGKYAGGGTGRLTGRLEDPRLAPAVALVDELRSEAASRATTPAALALEFALAHPRTASVLVGATTPGQVRENAAAVG